MQGLRDRKTSRLAVLAGALVLVSFAGAPASAAQDRPTDPAVTEVEDVTVIAQVNRRATGRFASQIANGPPGRLRARWDREVCIGVINMDREHALFLIERVSQVARPLGLRLGEPGCKADVRIYVTDQPDALTVSLTDTYPLSFRPARRLVSLGNEALERFRTSDAPVRWWHVSAPIMDGTNQLAMTVNSAEDPRQPMYVTVRNGSRLRGNTRDDLISVTIVLDLNQIGAVDFGALSDYVAMVALAPVDPTADAKGLNTVMNLFSQPEVTGLTTLDRDYLAALYSASRSPMTVSQQSAEIADRMTTARLRRARAEVEPHR